MNSSIIVRPAVPADVDAIFELLELYTASGVVLKRSKDDIAFYLKNFIVAEENGIADMTLDDINTEIAEARK